MRKMIPVWIAVAATVWLGMALAQSIKTDGDVETDGQLTSNVTTGTPPLEVSSTTVVPNLNADQVDGMEAAVFAQESDLQDVETLLVALQAQVNSLGLALVPRTGQSAVFATGDDGNLQLGVTWPNPRFTDNADGTVTDNLTSLIWLDDANCFGGQIWSDALATANALFDGCSDCGGTNNDCGLTDGSMAGEWRLPNVRELQSLAHYGVTSPAVPNTAGTGKWTADDPFSGVQLGFYWSFTTDAGNIADAWDVNMGNGFVGDVSKTNGYRVWPVRGGQ